MQNASKFTWESEIILKRFVMIILLTGLLFTGKAIAASSLTPNGSSTQIAPATTTYVVQSGDTLDSIAVAFNISQNILEALNKLSNPDLIYTGEHLFVPSPEQTLPSGAQAMVCTLTAYTDGYQSTGKVPGDPGYGITSTGQVAQQGLSIAVDPSVIPYGTPVYIPGIGVRIADDTGGAIIGNHIDVFYNNQQTAMDFGLKQGVVVYLLPRADVTYENGLPVLTSNIVGSTASSATNSTAKPISSLNTNSAIATQGDLSQSQADSGTTRNTNITANQMLSMIKHQKLIQPYVKKSSPTNIPGKSTTVQGNVLNVWVIALDQYVWQPMLETAKQSF